jgi:hypothetical protein
MRDPLPAVYTTIALGCLMVGACALLASFALITHSFNPGVLGVYPLVIALASLGFDQAAIGVVLFPLGIASLAIGKGLISRKRLALFASLPYLGFWAAVSAYAATQSDEATGFIAALSLAALVYLMFSPKVRGVFAR